MITIKNSKELKAHLNEHNDLILPCKDVRIEYQVAKGELRNVECGERKNPTSIQINKALTTIKNKIEEM